MSSVRAGMIRLLPRKLPRCTSVIRAGGNDSLRFVYRREVSGVSSVRAGMSRLASLLRAEKYCVIRARGDDSGG